MGVDFTAIVEHRLTTAELQALPDRLNADWELPASLAPWVAKYVHTSASRWQWNAEPRVISELQSVVGAYVDGPQSFHGLVCKHAFIVSFLARWWSFLYDEGVREGLEAATRVIALAMNGEHILYLPDSGTLPAAAADIILDGGTVPDAIHWLNVNVGPASSDFQALPGPNSDDPYGSAWFHSRPRD